MKLMALPSASVKVTLRPASPMISAGPPVIPLAAMPATARSRSATHNVTSACPARFSSRTTYSHAASARRHMTSLSLGTMSAGRSNSRAYQATAPPRSATVTAAKSTSTSVMRLLSLGTHYPTAPRRAATGHRQRRRAARAARRSKPSPLLAGWRVPQGEVVRALDTSDPEVAGDVDPAGRGIHGVGVCAGAVVADAGQAAAERRPGGVVRFHWATPVAATPPAVLNAPPA